MKELLAICPGNKAIEFIAERITDDNYRGDKSSQHNRYKMDDVICILTLFNKCAPCGKAMIIRTTDIPKRPNNTPGEAIYAYFCSKVTAKIHKGTQDAMRKNYFVDFHRMGFINRYNRNGEKVNPWEQSNIKYVSLSKQGIKLIKTVDLEEQFFIFSKGVDAMLGGYINLLLEIFRTPEYEIKNITIYEYMFLFLQYNQKQLLKLTRQNVSNI